MKKMNENGRSMLEMLGVLVIAGIITLGGMAGFRTAMNKMHANTIAEAVAEISVEAQTRNACIDEGDLDDFEKPKCVESMRGGRNGQVKVVFSSGDECDTIKELAGASFGKCRWENEEGYFLFIPSRGKKCPCPDPRAGCPACSDECEDYTKDSCL